MSIAYVQQSWNSITNGSSPLDTFSTGAAIGAEPTPFPSNVTAGNLLVYKASWGTGAISSQGNPSLAFSDNLGNQYHKICGMSSSNGYGNYSYGEIGYAYITTGGSCNVALTATVNSYVGMDTNQYIGIQVSEWSGLSTTAAFTTGQNAMSNTANSSNANYWESAFSTATPTLDTASGLAIGFYMDAGSSVTKYAGTGWTATNPNTTFWTYGNGQPGGGIEIYQLLSSTAGANANVLFAQYVGSTGPVMVAVFDPPSGSPVPKVFRWYANGSIQAHSFVGSASLPAGVVARMYANNQFVSSGPIVQTGTPHLRICANGQIQCNATIVV